jgi:hypothetical protein
LEQSWSEIAAIPSRPVPFQKEGEQVTLLVKLSAGGKHLHERQFFPSWRWTRQNSEAGPEIALQTIPTVSGFSPRQGPPNTIAKRKKEEKNQNIWDN